MEIVAIVLFATFVFWLARRILEKAGVPPVWAFTLIIPVVNIIMIWIFAFMDWPALPKTQNRGEREF